MLSPEPFGDLALKFLRPAPAKMSIKPRYIKANLFPDYKSVPPPEEDDHTLLDKMNMFQRRTIKLTGTKTSTYNEDEDEDEEDEEDNEGILILQKFFEILLLQFINHSIAKFK